MTKWENLTLVFSNFFMIFPIYWTFKKKYYIEMFIFSVTSLISIVYHTLGSFNNKNIYYSSVQFLDFYSASLVLSVMSVYLINYNTVAAKSIHILFLSYFIIFSLCFFLGIKDDPQSFQIAVISIALISMLIKLISRKKKPDWRYKKVLLSIPILSCGMVFFYISGPYWIFHSLWHMFIMISVYLGLNIPFTLFTNKKPTITPHHRRSFSV